MSEAKRHTISVLVENKFGVLARVAGLFSGRGYNITSLTVNETQDPNISNMTIVTRGDEAVLEQIEKQLNKLVNVIRVDDLTNSRFIERELVLLKIAVTTAEDRAHIAQLVEIFEGKIVTVTKSSLGVEISGRSDKVDNFIDMVRDFGILEMARSGRVAISRGKLLI